MTGYSQAGAYRVTNTGKSMPSKAETVTLRDLTQFKVPRRPVPNRKTCPECKGAGTVEDGLCMRCYGDGRL